MELQLEFPLEKPNPPLRLLTAFQQMYPDMTPGWLIQAPGRDTWIAAVGADAHYALASADQDSRTIFSRRSALFKRSVMQRPLPGWTRYASGVVIALCDAGFDVSGIRAVTLSEDRSFGPRHDHAVGMAVAALWHDICHQSYTPESILDLVERVRRTYVEG